MKLSKRTNTIVLWIISIGLLVGMVITFTPTLGGFGGSAGNQGRPAILVNGEPISELEVARARQNPLFSSVSEGQVGEDLDLLLIDQLVRQQVFDLAAARTRVSGGEVRQEVQNFRESQGVAGRRNDQAYLSLIGQSGFDDQSFRSYIEQRLRREKYEASLSEGVEVSDAEVETFYLANVDRYRSEDRIRARMIVLDDAELAAELRQRAQQGESFADLATEFSIERADRAGALGAPQGSSEPQPVGRAALPQAVATAAFGLRGSGLTDVVESGGRQYIVQVEEYLPEQTRPLSEVEDEVRADALEAKRAGVVRERIDRLMDEATITIPENSAVEYEDYPVARVGDSEVLASELALATYTNQQIQQNLNPQLAPLIVEFFKPAILENMIDQKLAYLGASTLDAEFVGTESQVARQALAYVARDAQVDDGAVSEYYEANTRRFTVPAEATVTRVDFDSQEAAESFRSALLSGSGVDAAAGEAGGTASSLGTVREGELEEALDRALFGTNAFEQLPRGEREVSDVLVLQTPSSPEEAAADTEAAGEGEASESEEPAAEENFVVLVATRLPSRVRPLAEVREQVEQAVLQAEQAELEQQWLDGLREEIEVTNLLARAQQSEEAEEPAGNGEPQEAPAEGEETGTAE
jgi:parvulin-like peptidyl-prolyl isomerase